MNYFTELLINEKLIALLSERTITLPTPVQKQVIPVIFSGQDCMFQSETGTGKTLAYLLPLFTRLLAQKEEEHKISAKNASYILIIAPTNELAAQIKNEAEYLLKPLGMKAALFIGGSPLNRQIDVLKEKPEVIVGGAARILELMRLKKLKIEHMQTLVLDEVDRLLSPELRDYVTEIITVLPEKVHIIACSATIKQAHIGILERAKEQSNFLRIELPPEDVLQRHIAHWAFYAEQREKIDMLRAFLYAEKPSKALIFCAHTGQIANIVGQLQYKKIACSTLHAKTDKFDRKKAIDDFRSGRVSILITSDLASRGLDIIDITHIIQMDVPQDDDFFIHRAGRTARAGKTGINAVFGDAKELRHLAQLEKKLGISIYPKMLYQGKIQEVPQDQK